jgi:hypothetical protein
VAVGLVLLALVLLAELIRPDSVIREWSDPSRAWQGERAEEGARRLRR